MKKSSGLPNCFGKLNDRTKIMSHEGNEAAKHMLYLNVVEAFDKVYEDIGQAYGFELDTAIQDKIESLSVMVTIQIRENL
jgi:hypothetical protein